jgi:hypothetical protein
MSTQKTPPRNSKPTSQKNLALSEGLLITGMHRSGTSMIAGLVEKCGVNQLGKNPMSAAADNRDGFFEDVTLIKISDEILRLSDGSWDVPAIPSNRDLQKGKLSESLIQTARKEVFQLRQDVAEPWFIKDPRICLTITEWKRILLLKTPLIYIVRNPHDVATSLMQRNNMKSKRALAIWYRYNYALLKSVERDQILVLDYDLTCGKPGAVQAGVESFLENVLSRGVNSKFEIEEQVIFNPRNYSRFIDLNDGKLSKESKDCFDLYRKISQFHLKTRLISLKLIKEPMWVEEELNIAQDESFTAAQLEENRAKAEYLFTELGQARDQVSERETELSQLRTETEQQRAELETQLSEAEAKADFLFSELSASRNLITQRDLELEQLRTETEQQRAELETQLSEAEAKADFLFSELSASRNLITQRDLELSQLRTETEQQRAELETQLSEAEAKADFLFSELGTARKTITQRDTEIAEYSTFAEHLFSELESTHKTITQRDLELEQQRTQLSEAEAKADFLFSELSASRNLITQRDLELEQQRTQLSEAEAKADYLFSELGTARKTITQRDTEIAELNNKTDCINNELSAANTLSTEKEFRFRELSQNLFNADRELTRLAIALQVQEDRNLELDKLRLTNHLLSDSSTRLFDDLQRLTGKKTYRYIRNIKLITSKLFIFRKHRNEIKNDVIPIICSATEYFDHICALEFLSFDYEELNPDVKRNNINPYTHIFMKGRFEGRVFPSNHKNRNLQDLSQMKS